ILAGGQEANVNGFEGGYWYEPTIITDVTPDMKAVQEEIFGPVVVIEQFSDDKDVIERANDTKYGLAAAIWTKSQGRATRVDHQLDDGVIKVNSICTDCLYSLLGWYLVCGFYL